MSVWEILKEAFDDDDDDLSSLVGAAKAKFGDRHATPEDDLVGRRLNHKLGVKSRTTPPPPPKKGAMWKIGGDKHGFPMSWAGDTPSDDTKAAAADAGLQIHDPAKKQADTDNSNRLRDLIAASRFADQVISARDKEQVKELVSVFALSFNLKRPITPGQLQKYTSRLMLAHTEEQAKNVLADLAAELRAQNK